MSEPTIDEMLAWLESAHSQMIASDNEEYVDAHYDGSMQRTVDAIRAILEQQRMLVAFNQGAAFGQLQIIRAFVDRVQERCDWNDGHWDLGKALRDELAAMEKENE